MINLTLYLFAFSHFLKMCKKEKKELEGKRNKDHEAVNKYG